MEILVKQTIESLRKDLGYEEWEDVNTDALLFRQGYEGYVIEVEDGDTFEIPEECEGQIIDEGSYYMNIEIFEGEFEKEVVEGDLELVFIDLNVILLFLKILYNSPSFEIGYNAFSNCTNLTRIDIIPNTTAIGANSFSGCSGLTSIEIPNSVTSIGDRAFYGCNGLTSVTLNSDAIVNKTYTSSSSNLKTIFGGQVLKYTIGDGVIGIGSYAFYECFELKELTIGNSVTSIGDYAFSGCSSGLTSITIGNSVTSIGYYAFYGCTSLPVENNLRYADTYLIEAVDKTLSTYTIKEGTKWIGNRAFYECSGLTYIVIPNSVTSIGDYAFCDCSDMESIVLPDVLKEIGDYAFANTCLTSIEIPNLVTSIGGGAFENCKVLSDVKIGKSVENIGNYAFYKCLCLDSIDIPHGVISIGDYTFYGCQSLRKVKIPSSVRGIGSDAFRKCPNLEDVYVGWNKPISISSSIFDKTNGYILSTLWVPMGRINFYKVTDPWGKFVEIKEWDSSTGIKEIGLTPALHTREGVTYNLQGVEVNDVKQGEVYIRNGKKFIAR